MPVSQPYIDTPEPMKNHYIYHSYILRLNELHSEGAYLYPVVAKATSVSSSDVNVSI